MKKNYCEGCKFYHKEGFYTYEKCAKYADNKEYIMIRHNEMKGKNCAFRAESK